MYIITIEKTDSQLPQVLTPVAVKIIWDNILPKAFAQATVFVDKLQALATARVLARKLNIGFENNPFESRFILNVTKVTDFNKPSAKDISVMFMEMDDAEIISPETAYFNSESSDWALSPCNVFAVGEEAKAITNALVAGALNEL